METSKNVSQLILSLDNCLLDQTDSCYLDAMKRIAIPLREWERYFSFKPERPSRVLLEANDSYHLFLSCWEKDQTGPIHDLPAEAAWIHPITGCLTEETFRHRKSKKELEQLSSVLLTTQCYSFIQPLASIVRYKNTYGHRSVCLHLFANPREHWKIFDPKSGEAKHMINEYDAHMEELIE